MDTTINGIVVILLLAFIYLLIKTATPKKAVKSSNTKKEEIIKSYEQKLIKELKPYKDDKQALQDNKIRILKEISAELSRNIYFDKNEIKNIIETLARKDI